MSETVLEVRELRVAFKAGGSSVIAVDGVSFSVARGRTLGIVGESGCGKSATALSILRLMSEAGQIVGGEIFFQGADLLRMPEPELRRIRGRRIGMVFQEPMTSLNPAFTVGTQIGEGLRLHLGATRGEARDRSIDLLRRVGIGAAEQRARAYPHQLSGGMRQRAMIALALACDPDLLIADELTTALDVTLQAQILEVLREEQRARQMAVLLITHDLGVVADSCDEVAVMYAGRVVEQAPVEQLFARPAHPYSAGLLASVPALSRSDGSRRLKAIPGTVPSLSALPSGCRFRTRCDRASDVCARVDPPLAATPDGRLAACHHPVPA